MAEAEPPRKPRVVAVDALRLIAAAQMIQGHSIDAVLAERYRSGPWFSAWTFARGLTSTTFLVTAGLSFVLALEAAGDAGLARSRRARRALQLIAIGYLMHAPLGGWFGGDPLQTLRESVVVDVLQCIGVSLLSLELLCAWLPRGAGRTLTACALGAGCFALAPAADALTPEGLARVLVNYVSARGGSLFPLLPWMGFVWFGFGVGSWALAARRGAQTALRLGLAGLAAGLASWALRGSSEGLPQRLSPSFCALKLALVLFAAALASFWLRERTRLPGWLARLSSETLFLYVSHVLILYAGHVGIAAHWGGRAGPAGGLVLTLVLAFLCGVGALGYPRLGSALRQRWGRGTPGPSRAETSLPPG